MRRRLVPLAVGALVGAWLLGAPDAHAQSFAERSLELQQPRIASPQSVTWNLIRVGMYEAPATEFEGFGNDRGPLVGTEVGFHLFRIPYVGPVALGGRVGWARYSGRTLIEGEPQGESTSLTIFPVAPVASLRIETLARQLDIPFVFTGKIGMHVIPWRLKTGGSTDARGGSFGLLWAAQVDLELDFLEPRAARRLDEEWGINHSYLFFELFGSTAGRHGGGGDGGGATASPDTLPLGANLAWVAGLGFVI